MNGPWSCRRVGGEHGRPRVAGQAKDGWKLQVHEEECVPGRWGGLSPSLLAPSRPLDPGTVSLGLEPRAV